jgi:hypothetical protein
LKEKLMDRQRRMSLGGGSGASAAKADLASLRAQQPSEADKKAIEKVTQIFRLAEAGINAVRTYEAGHPAIERAIGSWHTILKEFTSEHHELVVTLEGRSLFMDGEQVYGVHVYTRSLADRIDSAEPHHESQPLPHRRAAIRR